MQDTQDLRQLTIKDIVNSDPIKVFKLTAEGIDKFLEIDNWLFDMSSFGRRLYRKDEGKEGYVCCGCIAAVSIQEITQKHYTVDVITDEFCRGEFLNIHHEDIVRFEDAMDAARQGNFKHLYTYCGCELPQDLEQFRFRLYSFSSQVKSNKEKAREVSKIFKEIVSFLETPK